MIGNVSWSLKRSQGLAHGTVKTRCCYTKSMSHVTTRCINTKIITFAKYNAAIAGGNPKSGTASTVRDYLPGKFASKYLQLNAASLNKTLCLSWNICIPNLAAVCCRNIIKYKNSWAHINQHDVVCTLFETHCHKFQLFSFSHQFTQKVKLQKYCAEFFIQLSCNLTSQIWSNPLRNHRNHTLGKRRKDSRETQMPWSFPKVLASKG